MSGVSKLITLLLVVAFALLAIVKLTNKIPDQTTVISADFVTYSAFWDKLLVKFVPQVREFLKAQGIVLSDPKQFMTIVGLLEAAGALLLPFTYFADVLLFPICGAALYTHVLLGDGPERYGPPALLIVLLLARSLFAGSSSDKKQKRD